MMIFRIAPQMIAGLCLAGAVDSTAYALGVPVLGLPALAPTREVTASGSQIALGRQLFFDRRLSRNGTMSCAMCHVPEQGFTSTASRVAIGIEGKSLPRNAPTLLNVAWQQSLFHDGRAESLTMQAWVPLLHPDEMGNGSVNEVLQRIRTLSDYAAPFAKAYPGREPSKESVGFALAAFESTLVSGNSRFDRWRYGGNSAALSEEEEHGYALFEGKGRCTTCHLVGKQSALFTDHKFHATGAGETVILLANESFVVPLAPGVSTILTKRDIASITAPVLPDLGRFEVTKVPTDRYAFRTPTLRNVNRTAPYMHNGSLATLEEVLSFYNRGGNDVMGKSPLITPLALTAAEQRAIVAFLRTLDGHQPSVRR
jgi:cytochrome c peroxidase